MVLRSIWIIDLCTCKVMYDQVLSLSWGIADLYVTWGDDSGKCVLERVCD